MPYAHLYRLVCTLNTQSSRTLCCPMHTLTSIAFPCTVMPHTHLRRLVSFPTHKVSVGTPLGGGAGREDVGRSGLGGRYFMLRRLLVVLTTIWLSVGYRKWCCHHYAHVTYTHSAYRHGHTENGCWIAHAVHHSVILQTVDLNLPVNGRVRVY